VNAKITSKQLYAGLRDALALTLRSEGFSRTKGGWLGWTRRRDGEHLTFWFQCDRWGWDPAFGSRFTLEFQLGGTPVPAEGSLEFRVRYAELLSADELVRELNKGDLHMILVVYATLGVFLIRAARDAVGNRSLLLFTAWSSVAHGLLMAGQAIALDKHGHLAGDVSAMLVLGFGLAWLMPPQPSERDQEWRRPLRRTGTR
jgi:uncharacterized protein DUF6632